MKTLLVVPNPPEYRNRQMNAIAATKALHEGVLSDEAIKHYHENPDAWVEVGLAHYSRRTGIWTCLRGDEDDPMWQIVESLKLTALPEGLVLQLDLE